MIIKQYEYVKKEVDSKEFIPPIETKYYFETHIRRSIRIVPIWTEWNHEKGIPEEIYKYHITCVYDSYETKIERFILSSSDIERHYYGKYTHTEFVKAWVDDHFTNRSKEQFLADLKVVLDKIQNTSI